MILYVFFVSGTLRAVEIELEIVRGSQAAHLKDGIVIFQNLQKIENSSRGKVFMTRDFSKFSKISQISRISPGPHNKKTYMARFF